jgi:DNA-directed RNA polymerase specialized sigma subunit, sigma24 homolog
LISRPYAKCRGCFPKQPLFHSAMQRYGSNNCQFTTKMDHNKLVKDCLRNKPEAQRQLYEHFAETMLGVCYRYTKSIKDAEDILQEGFIKVFFNLRQYRNQGELGAWVRRIMVTTALNFLNAIAIIVSRCTSPLNIYTR